MAMVEQELSDEGREVTVLKQVSLKDSLGSGQVNEAAQATSDGQAHPTEIWLST